MMISTESLAALNATLLMSSREIARITGITHGEVKRLIKSLETAQRLSQPVTVNHYEHEGETRQEFQLNKRDSLLAVARLSLALPPNCWTAGRSGKNSPICPISLIRRKRHVPGQNSLSNAVRRNSNWR